MTAWAHKTPDAWKNARRKEKRDRIAIGLLGAFFIIGLLFLGIGVVQKAIKTAKIDVMIACHVGADCK